MSDNDRVLSNPPSTANPVAEDGIGLKIPVTIGITVILLFFGAFGAWAMLAPLESAAIAPGVVSVESKRKTIQHLEGGIVGEIRVKDGDEVNAGDELVVLDETQPRAALALINSRYLAARALEARLIAERDGQDTITFPPVLNGQRGDQEIAEIIEGQTNIFNARRRSIKGQTAIMEKRVAQFNEEIEGLKGQAKAQEKQLELANDEIESFQKLFDKGLSDKSRLRQLQRELAQVTGAHSKNIAAIAGARQNINEAQLQISELKTKFLNEVVQQLGDVQKEIYELNEKIRSAEDVLKRTVIRAPMAGTIVGLQVHTVGGVIAPGQALLDIVPKDEQLVVEAYINPDDIDIVEPGLTAQVRLTALSRRHTLPIEGHVLTVSADRLTNERTGEAYYLARVLLPDNVSELLGEEVLYPGMKAEVMIVTGARTTFEYLSRPITRSMNRAFREK